MDTYFQEHAKNYETCDYATFTFSYEAQSAQTGLYLTQEEAANYAKSLETCKDLSAFQSWVSNYYKQSDQELSQLEIQQAVEKTYQENIGYTEGSAISEWIFDENAAVGDSQIFQSESSNSFTVCLLLTQPEREEAPTVNVRHILIRSDSYASDEEAKAQAEAIYQEWKTVPKPKIPSANWLKNIRRTPQKKDSMKMYIQAKWLHPLMTGALMMHENQVIPALWKVPMDITFCISFRKTTRQPGRCWSTRI